MKKVSDKDDEKYQKYMHDDEEPKEHLAKKKHTKKEHLERDETNYQNSKQ